MSDETFGQFVKRLRTSPEIGLSQSDLGKLVGVTRGYINLIEQDGEPSGKPPQVAEDKLRRLARALRVSEQEIFRRGIRLPENYILTPADVAYLPNPDSAMIVEAYEGANPTGRRAIKSAAELAQEISREGAIGKRTE